MNYFKHKALKREIGSFAAITVLVVEIVIFGVLETGFLSFSNFSTIARSASLLLIVSTAGTIPILTGNLDFSVIGVITLLSFVIAYLLSTFNLAMGIIVAVLLGTFFGFMQGFVISKFKVSSFIVTLATTLFFTGCALFISKGEIWNVFSWTFRSISVGQTLALPNSTWVGIGVYVLLTVVLMRTPLYRMLLAVGSSETAARNSGINVEKTIVLAFTLSGTFFGLGAVIATASLAGADNTIATNMLLPYFAAIVVGGTPFGGGRGGPHRTALGVAVIAVLWSGMNIGGIQYYVQQIIFGCVIIGTMFLTSERGHALVVK